MGHTGGWKCFMFELITKLVRVEHKEGKTVFENFVGCREQKSFSAFLFLIL